MTTTEEEKRSLVAASRPIAAITPRSAYRETKVDTSSSRLQWDAAAYIRALQLLNITTDSLPSPEKRGL
jgi:hypothetical protein